MQKSQTNKASRRLFSEVLGHSYKGARLLGSVIALFLLVVMLISVESTHATFPGSNGKITFSSNRDSGSWMSNIFTMNADGSEQINITNDQAEDYDRPTWSPDGTKMAFRTTRDGGSDIFVMSADGSGQKNLTILQEASASFPTWSQNGKEIAFYSAQEGKKKLLIINADGGGRTKIISDMEGYWDLKWSPDGKKFAFSHYPERNNDIYVVNANGTRLTNITKSPKISESSPAWSPDGKKIVFTRRSERNSGIYIMNANGTKLINVTKNTNAMDSSPVWSPDGKKFAFTRSLNGNSEIYVMNADGGEQKNLTRNPHDDFDPDWQASAMPSSDTKSPEMGLLKITSRFTPSKKTTPVGDTVTSSKKDDVKRGATISYTLSEAATVKLYMEKKMKGLKLMMKGSKRKRLCEPDTKKNRRKLASQIKSKYKRKKLSNKKLKSEIRKASCILFNNQGTLTRPGTKGKNKVPFSGRIGKRKLVRGSYRLVAIATDSAGNNSKPKFKSFKIVSTKKRKAEKHE